MTTNYPPSDENRHPTLAQAPAEHLREGLLPDAIESPEAEQRRQAQLATPPPFPWAAPSATSTSEESASDADEITTWDFAAARLPQSLAFKRILVPLDGSARAESALPVAARIARASGGSILMVQAVSPQVMGVMGSVPVEASVEAALDAASAYLRGVAHREEFAGIEVTCEALRSVSPATALLAAIERYQSDLVVICSHGRSGIVRWALGSVAQKLVRQAAAPVLVLRPGGLLRAAERKGNSAVRALVMLDGSALAEAALAPTGRLVAALAGRGPAELHLLRVVDRASIAGETPVLPYRTPEEEALEEARSYLYSVSQRFREGELAKLGLKITWSMRTETDAVCGILDEAEGDASGEEAGEEAGEGGAAHANTPRSYDLLAMATHGRAGPKLWAAGSTTDRVLHTTHMPLLVVRPGEAED